MASQSALQLSTMLGGSRDIGDPCGVSPMCRTNILDALPRTRVVCSQVYPPALDSLAPALASPGFLMGEPTPIRQHDLLMLGTCPSPSTRTLDPDQPLWLLLNADRLRIRLRCD